MNKIYKVIWSKAKNCYVVASELAKSHTKAPTVGAVSRTLVAGVLASVVSCGAVMPLAHATQNPPANSNYVLYIGTDAALIELEGAQGTGTRITNLAAGTLSAASTDAVNGAQLYALSQQVDDFQSALSTNSTTIATVQSDVNRLKTSYLNLNSDVATLGTQVDTGFNVNVNGAKAKTVNPDSNFINFKNGTGIAVSNDGGAVKISLATDGAVASGNGSAITGGTAYTELRPADGNYVARANTTAANLAALDTRLKTTVDGLATETTNRTNADTALSDRIGSLTADGNYIKASNAKNVAENLVLLDTQVKANADAIALETANRTTAVNNEAAARENADTALTNKIGAIASNGNYITKDGTVFANLSALDTRAKTNADAIASINANAGALTADGNYILKNNTIAQNLQALDTKIGSASSANGTYAKTANTVNANIKALDTQLKTTTDNLAQEVTNRTTAVTNEATARSAEDTNLSNRIGSVASDGNYIKASSSKNVAENLGLLDTQVKANANSVMAEAVVRESADTALSDRVGEVARDKTYIKASSDTDIAGNLELLDDALTATDANLAQEISDRETADTALTNKIGAIASNGNYITKDGTVFANLSALDTRAKANADAISQEVTDRTTAVANEATARSTEDTNLSNRIGSVDADGSYIKASSDKNVGENLVLLDTQLKSVTDSIGALDADGNYIAVANTVNQNIKALDTRLRSTVVGLNNEVTNRTQAVNDEAFARSTEDANLSNRIGTVADGEYNYIHASSSSNVAENLVLLDTSLKNTNDTVAANKTAIEESLVNTVSALEDADEELSDRIGTVADSGNYIQASSSKNVAENLGILDTKLKVVEDALETAGADFATAIGELSVDGTTIRKANNVSQNLALLDTALKATNDNIGVLASNGNYIVTTNTVYQNVSALDAQVKNINTTLEDVVSYDGGTHAKATLAGSGGTTLSNVKAGALNASSTDAVNGAQLYATNQNISGFATDINRNKTNIQNLNVSVTAALESVSTTSELVDTINNLKADASLNNLTAAGRQVIASAAANAVQEYMAAQNGTSSPQAPVLPTYPDGSSYTAPSGVYEVTTGPNGETVDGSSAVSPVAPVAPVASVASAAPVAPVSDDGDASSDASAVSTPVRRFAAPMVAGTDNGGNGTDGNSGGGLRSVSPSAGTNYVVYDDASAGTITLEGATGTGTKITNVADGELSAASTDAVNGGQLYAVTQQFDDFQSALSRNNTSIARAQTDINNIKTTNLNLQSQVQTLNTQVGTGLNVTVDGALVKNMNPDSAFVNIVTGDNVTIENDNGSVKISANNDGRVRSGDTGLVSGATVYNAIQDAIAGSETGTGTALTNKANTDASNVGVNAETDNSGAWGQALGSGEIADGNGKLVTGGTVYRETRVASDGNYVTANSSAGANLSALDTAVKANADDIASLKDMSDISTAGQTVIGDIAQDKVETETRVSSDGNYVGAGATASENLVVLDTAVKGVADDVADLKDMSNITDEGKTVIRDLAKGSVKVVSGNKTNVTVGTQGDATTYAVNVVADGTVASGNTGLVTGGAVYDAVNQAVEGIVAGTAVTDELANAVAQRIGNGTVESGNTGYVTGGAVYDAISERMGSTNIGTGVTEGTAYGEGATVNGDGGTAVGDNSQAGGENAVAVGQGTSATGDGSTAIGTGSSTDGDGSVALGNDASSEGNGAVAVGGNSSSTGAGATAVGQGSTADGTNSTAIGAGAAADAGNALAVGGGSSATGDDSTAVGTNSSASADGTSALGNGANASGVNSTAVGTDATASADNTSVFGNGANAGGAGSTALGTNATADAGSSVAVGNGSHASGADSTAVGTGTVASADDSSAYGNGANAGGVSSSAFGSNAVASADDALAVGADASADGDGSTAVGTNSNASATGSSAFGNGADAGGVNSSAFGYDADASANGSTAVGNGSSAGGVNSTAFGLNASAGSDYGTAVGDGSGATGEGSVAVGHNSSVGTAGGVGLGSNASVTGTDSVALGSGSVASDDDVVSLGHTASDVGPDGNAYGSDLVRRIVNVADGTSATDAATVGQVREYVNGTRTTMTADGRNSLGQDRYVLDVKVDGEIASGNTGLVTGGAIFEAIKNIGSGSTGAGTSGSTAIGDGSSTTNDNSVAVGGNSTASGENTVAVGTGSTVDGGNSTAVGTNSEVTGDNSVGFGNDTSVTGEGSVAVGTGSTVTGDSSTAMGSGSSAVGDNAVAVGDNANAGTSNSVAVGSNSEATGDDAVSIGTGSSVTGDDAVALGSGAQASADDTVAIGNGSAVSGAGSVALGSDTNVTGDNAVSIGGSSSATGNDAVALGGNAQATGQDTVAIGNGTTVSGEGSAVIGSDASATGTNSVALGTDSVASDDSVVSLGHTASDVNSDGDAYGSDLARRIVNVADGTSASDAATVGQTYVLQDSTNTVVREVGTNDIGQRIYRMEVKVDGRVEEGNTGLVSGGDIYEAIHSLSSLGGGTVTDGAQDAVAVGNDSSVSGDGGVAVGNGSSSSSGGAVAVGTGSSSTAEGGVAVGSGSSSSSEGAVAVGTNSSVEKENSVAIGGESTVTGSDAVAVGGNTQVTSDNGVAVGGNSQVTSDNGVAVGGNAQATSTDAIALGGNTSASSEGAVAVGGNSTADGTNAVAFGKDSSATDDNATALGGNSVASGQDSVAMGGNTSASAQGAVAVGGGSTAEGENAVALGMDTTATGDNATALGGNTVATGQDAVALGSNSVAGDDNVVSVGHKASDKDANGNEYGSGLNRRIVNVADGIDDSDVATVGQLRNAARVIADDIGNGQAEAGDLGLVTGDTLYKNVTELQTQIDAKVTHGVSINSVDGNDTNFDSTGAVGDNAMALGVSAGATGEDAIAVGHGSKAEGKQSIALGTGNTVSGDHSGAFGDPNNVSGTASYAFGNDNTVSGDNTFVLGNNVSNATGNNAVVLGNGSDGSMDNVVSIGSAGAERKIVHVADGDVSADSKEAVNGGQLFSFKRALEQAENIDADKWAEKLGTGEVAEGDSNLVTGGTVYNAIRDLNVAPGSITEDFANGELHIGGGTAYDNVDTVNFAKSDGTSRVITGVATNPQDPSSAANVAYVDAVGQNIINGVNNEFTKVNDRMDKVGAGAAAMAGLVPGSFDDGEKWNFSAAVGNYRSATAGAVGMFYKPTENVTVAVKGAFGNGENMVSGGVGIALSKGNVPGVTKAQLARAVNAQADKLTEATRVIQQMSAERQADRERIAELERKLSRLETAQKQ